METVLVVILIIFLAPLLVAATFMVYLMIFTVIMDIFHELKCGK